MHRSTVAAAAALLACAVPVVAVPAAAAPASGNTAPHARVAERPVAEDAEPPVRPAPSRGLFLTLSGSENTWIRGVLLHCSPEPSGPHPEAAAACAALDTAHGDLDRLPGQRQACTKQYEPVTVSATGAWRGRPTAWHKTFANACELAAATGAVFRF